MPNYSRQVGLANVTGITAIRLIDKSIITSQAAYSSAAAIALPLAVSDITKLYSFIQLNGSGELSYSQEATEAGVLYNYNISWAYARNRIGVMPLLDAIKSTYFVIAVADGNGSFMLLGTPTAPFEVMASFDAAAGDYNFEAQGSTLTPPQFITGIFNTQLYTGGTGTV
jgi:hypothetical protein